jgi:hypothetical protein
MVSTRTSKAPEIALINCPDREIVSVIPGIFRRHGDMSHKEHVARVHGWRSKPVAYAQEVWVEVPQMLLDQVKLTVERGCNLGLFTIKRGILYSSCEIRLGGPSPRADPVHQGCGHPGKPAPETVGHDLLRCLGDMPLDVMPLPVHHSRYLESLCFR